MGDDDANRSVRELFDEHSIGQTCDPPTGRKTYLVSMKARRRCYWAIVDGEAKLRMLGPLLRSHAAQESQRIRGTTLFDWVHPLDLHDFKAGFSALVEEQDIHGHSIECRYSRLPRIRRKLGAISPPSDPTAHLVVEDENWVLTRLVLSFVTEKAILCFFHVINDQPAEHVFDNKGRAIWSDACGPDSFFFPAPAYLSPEDRQALAATLSELETSDQDQSSVVFQCLDSSDDSLLFSYPSPDEQQYSVDQYAEWARAAMVSVLERGDGKTGCTRRATSRHHLPAPGGIILEIESGVWRWGCIAFAAFKTTRILQNGPPAPLRAKRDHDKSISLDLQELPGSKRQRIEVEEARPTALVTPWLPLGPQPPLPSTEGSQRIPLPVGHGFPPQSYGPSLGYGPPHLQPLDFRFDAHHSRLPPMANGFPALDRPRDLVFPPQQRRPSLPELSGSFPDVPPEGEQRPPTLSRSEKNMKDCTKICASCSTKSSPEWRKGPSGAKVLCNACGLRYARSVSGRKKAEKKAAEIQAKLHMQAEIPTHIKGDRVRPPVIGLNQAQHHTPPSVALPSSYGPLIRGRPQIHVAHQNQLQ